MGKQLAIGIIFVNSKCSRPIQHTCLTGRLAMGQVPWLQSLLKMLPQRGPLETFQKARP
jgi:hypothetical protein